MNVELLPVLAGDARPPAGAPLSRARDAEAAPLRAPSGRAAGPGESRVRVPSGEMLPRAGPSRVPGAREESGLAERRSAPPTPLPGLADAGCRARGRWAAPVVAGLGAHPTAAGGTHRRAGGRGGEPTGHSRGAAVAVLVGDGLDAAAPRHGDVAVEEAEVDAHHRHPAARWPARQRRRLPCGCGRGGRVLLGAAAPGTEAPTGSRGETSRGRCAPPLEHRAGPPRGVQAAGPRPLRFGRRQPAVAGSAPARWAAGDARAPRLGFGRLRQRSGNGCPGAAGSRKIWKVEAAEPAGWGGGEDGGRGGEEGEGTRRVTRALPRRLSVVRPPRNQRLCRHPRVLSATRDAPAADGTLPRRASSRAPGHGASGPPAARAPTRLPGRPGARPVRRAHCAARPRLATGGAANPGATEPVVSGESRPGEP